MTEGNWAVHVDLTDEEYADPEKRGQAVAICLDRLFLPLGYHAKINEFELSGSRHRVEGELVPLEPQPEVPLDFSRALALLKEGRKLQRRGWNGPGQYVALNLGTEGSMTVAFLFIHTVDGNRVPWLASQTDMLADDWAVVP